jgi:hypothetical protein
MFYNPRVAGSSAQLSKNKAMEDDVRFSSSILLKLKHWNIKDFYESDKPQIDFIINIPKYVAYAYNYKRKLLIELYNDAIADIPAATREIPVAVGELLDYLRRYKK